MPKSRISHDTSYKSLFSNSAMVKSLLLEFIPDSFVMDFNFDTLEHCAGSYITDDLRERRNDIIWRLRWKDTWCYIYIMIEFQSTQDHWMALRMLTYTALLWEDLVKTGVVKIGDKLPPVFPIVLYNGDSTWMAARDLSELVCHLHPDLDAYQPRHKYRVLDEKRVPKTAIQKSRGEAAYILRVEQANSADEICRIAVAFDAKAWEENFVHTRLSMLEWMDQKILQIGSQCKNGSEPLAKQEESVLAELIDKYKRPYIDEGRAEGLVKGRLEGRKEGMIYMIKDMLSAKFGVIPADWEKEIAGIQEPDLLLKLSRSINNISSPAEVEGLFKNLR